MTEFMVNKRGGGKTYWLLEAMVPHITAAEQSNNRAARPLYICGNISQAMDTYAQAKKAFPNVKWERDDFTTVGATLSKRTVSGQPNLGGRPVFVDNLADVLRNLFGEVPFATAFGHPWASQKRKWSLPMEMINNAGL